MKKLLLFFAMLLSIAAFSQSKKELHKKVVDLSNQVENQKLKIDSISSVNLKITELNKTQTICIDSLNSEIEFLKNKISEVKNEQILKNVEQSNENKEIVQNQCKATTSSGLQCSRKAESGSDYCWQHKNQKSDSQGSKPSESKSISSGSSGSSNNVGTIYTGPRGGKYYYNSSGKKVYIKH